MTRKCRHKRFCISSEKKLRRQIGSVVGMSLETFLQNKDRLGEARLTIVVFAHCDRLAQEEGTDAAIAKMRSLLCDYPPLKMVVFSLPDEEGVWGNRGFLIRELYSYNAFLEKKGVFGKYDPAELRQIWENNFVMREDSVFGKYGRCEEDGFFRMPNPGLLLMQGLSEFREHPGGRLNSALRINRYLYLASVERQMIEGMPGDMLIAAHEGLPDIIKYPIPFE